MLNVSPGMMTECAGPVAAGLSDEEEELLEESLGTMPVGELADGPKSVIVRYEKTVVVTTLVV